MEEDALASGSLWACRCVALRPSQLAGASFEPERPGERRLEAIRACRGREGRLIFEAGGCRGTAMNVRGLPWTCTLPTRTL